MSRIDHSRQKPRSAPRRRPRRRRQRRIWLAFAATAVIAAAALVAALALEFGSVLGDQATPPPTDPSVPGAPTAPAQQPTGPATPAPRPPARPAGPIVNGRRQPPRVAVPTTAGGRYTVVPGTARPPKAGRGRLIRYLVEVERGLPFKGPDFAAAVHRTLNDPRSWGHGGRLRFQRVDKGPATLRVSLSSPTLTSRKCQPLPVGLQLSCWQRGRAVINARRWGQGAATYGRDLASYREYVINHEVGHGLGHGHARCPGRRKPAPVMVQQTKSLYGCRPNPWPAPR